MNKSKLIIFSIFLMMVVSVYPRDEKEFNIEKVKNSQFLLTYHRSGTNMFIVTTQLLFRKPVRRLHDPFNAKGYQINLLELKLDNSRPTMYRTHIVRSCMDKIDKSCNKLILILRNYKECLVSQNKYSVRGFVFDVINSVNEEYQDSFKSYITNLQYFENWENESTKLLIYYEDFVQYPEETISKIIEFFDEEPIDLDEFYKSYYEQIGKAYNSYKATSHHGKSNRQLIYHSKNFPKDVLYTVDEHIEKTYPLLWEKYLNRYKTL